jgi:hypothetical protein
LSQADLDEVVNQPAVRQAGSRTVEMQREIHAPERVRAESRPNTVTVLLTELPECLVVGEP